MSEQTTEERLIGLLKKSSEAKQALEKAKLTLTPLQQAYDDASEEVVKAMDELRKEAGHDSVHVVKRRKSPKPYNLSPEMKRQRVGKASYTRAINNGKTEKEAKAAQKSAEVAFDEKFGRAAGA